ncbi:MAG TPA: hypothetical protein VFS43_04190 [Polyangiaceae bacterium]|nr:hypothetical protein [Polyangiaceae bacterium]
MAKLLGSFGLCALTGALGTLSAPAYAQQESSMMQPMGDYTPEHMRPNRLLLFGSGTLLLGAYSTSALVGIVNEREADARLSVPIAGPWLDLADRQCDRTPCANEGLSKAALIASGVLQGVGLVGVITSFLVPERRTQVARAAVAPRLRVAPAPLGGGRGGSYGLALVGTF